YDIPPPPLEKSDQRWPGHDPRYKNLSEPPPVTECLKDTVARFLPYWHETIAPAVRSGKRIIVAAHGNSLRALVKYRYHLPDEPIINLNIPAGVLFIHDVDEELKPLRHYSRGAQSAIEGAMQAVANQGKPK